MLNSFLAKRNISSTFYFRRLSMMQVMSWLNKKIYPEIFRYNKKPFLGELMSDLKSELQSFIKTCGEIHIFDNKAIS